MTIAPAGQEWLELDDGDESTWLFDVEFLLSSYECIYGRGCPSIDPEPDHTGTIGCCRHGAHFLDRDDRKRVEANAERLTADEWQHIRRAEERGSPFKKKKGDWVTRKADGACIFLNDADFAGGAGCALHIGAVNRGERPLDWKPTVCWQLPIRLDVHEDDYGYETVLVRAWKRRDWGPGGADFHWWCTEEDDAYRGRQPLYLTSRDELVELMGIDLYQRLAAELERRQVETPVTLGRRPAMG